MSRATMGFLLAFGFFLVGCGGSPPIDLSKDDDEIAQEVANSLSEDEKQAFLAAYEKLRDIFSSDLGRIAWLHANRPSEVIAKIQGQEAQVQRLRESWLQQLRNQVLEASAKELETMKANAAALSQRVERRRRGEEWLKVSNPAVVSVQKSYGRFLWKIEADFENTSNRTVSSADLNAGVIRIGRKVPDEWKRTSFLIDGGLEPGEKRRMSFQVILDSGRRDDHLPWVRPRYDDWGEARSPERTVWGVQREAELMEELVRRLNSANLSPYEKVRPQRRWF